MTTHQHLRNLERGVLNAAERGWLKGIDGRRVKVRSAHAALNSLLQSCGAIIMKVWLRNVMKAVEAEGLDVLAVGNIHDEGQFDVAIKDVERFKQVCEAAMLQAGEELKTRIAIEGEAMEGTTWADTH